MKEEHQLSVDSLQRHLDANERELIALRQKEQQQPQQQKTIVQNEETSFDISNIERQEGEVRCSFNILIYIEYPGCLIFP